MYACKYEFIKTGALNLHGDKEEGTNVGRIKWYTYPRVLLSFLFFFLHFSLPLPISSPCHSLHKRGRGNIARRKKGRVESLICSFVYYAVSTREWFVTGQRCVQTQSQGWGGWRAERRGVRMENTNSHLFLLFSRAFVHR